MGKKKQPDGQLTAIANRLKELRIKAGFTSYENFALDHGIERKQYWRLETGKNFMMTSLLRILAIHKISLDEFFRGMK